MYHLEEVSLSLEAIIQKICETEPTENNTEGNFTTEECFDFECDKKISTHLNEISGALGNEDIDVVSNQGKSRSYNFNDSVFDNEKENTEKQFSVSEKLEITETSSGFEDLSTTKYDDNKFSSQETEHKSNETTECKFTTNRENGVEPSEDCVIDENEHDEEKPRMLTSTPKHEKNENSFRFNSLDNLNDNNDDSSPSDFNEERENGEYLNLTIDEAIKKYEKVDSEKKFETKFREVSVQTIISQLLAVQCRCGILNSKIGDEKISVSSSQHPPLKKSKMEENFLNESESSKLNERNQEGLKSQQKVSSSHFSHNSLSTKANTTTIIVKNEDGSLCFKKISPRIRIGLSKRAKPPPLHTKLIY